MLNKADFIDYILNGGESEAKRDPIAPVESALPEGFEGFDDFATEVAPAPQAPSGSSFARRLLEATGFGNPAFVQRTNVIRSGDAVARHLPERVAFWPKTPSRPYQTLLFEADLDHEQLLNIPAFRSRTLAHLDIVEDALARLVSEALDGFQRGGEGVTADVRKGSKEETLCVVSILDKREGQAVRLICFGTQNKHGGGLETFLLTEQTRRWDGQLAREHLGLLYERQFKKLVGQDWQEAFTTTEERKQAEKLLTICTGPAPQEHDIQEGVLDLLDSVAKGFGLRKKANAERRLQAFALPSDHDIGIDPEERQSAYGGQNPFGGVTLRDGHNRLLGYIVYPLKSTADAARLRRHLLLNNRFHNVLVVYPDRDQASIELWQGREQLTGKLRKGQGYKDAADVVNLLSRFFVVSKAKVRNPTELAQELAYRARYLRRLAVKQLGEESVTGPLRDLYNAFKEALVHDLTEDKFADAYAQTITYGLLTARWTGNAQLAAAGERLTRQTALKHLPASSPFLKEFFKSVLSVRLDEQRGRLLWLVDDIADLLDRVDVGYVFGAGDPESTSARDPVIHFYEPFLDAYDPQLKKDLGVFYTPRPIVSYIVRSVHELLQTEFGLEDGLASTTTWGEMLTKHPNLQLPPLTDEPNETRTISKDEPFVLILDPATGTATFLVEVIDVIYRTLEANWTQQGLSDDQQLAKWNDYVPKHLLPRLHAYELMMAPYAIAHMKVDLKLAETGYHFGTEERTRIYLTNALETWVKQPPMIGFDALAHEAAAVNDIKRRKRFTIVIGNPPYLGESSNNSAWISSLIRDYHQVDGQPLGEANPRWLQDDYVKFMRLSQQIASISGIGIVGLITNHAYMDNATFRGARQSLLYTFPYAWFLDLHGNLKKKEHHPDKSVDINIFEIQQGVSISIMASFISNHRPQVNHFDVFGTREAKHEFLDRSTLANTEWRLIKPISPFYLFIPQDQTLFSEYQSFYKITDIMPLHSNGIVTARDRLCICWSAEEVWKVVSEFSRMEPEKARMHFNLGGDSRDWQVKLAQADIKRSGPSREYIKKIYYRPFDIRWTYFTGRSRGYLCMPRRESMSNMLSSKNVALITSRMTKGESFQHVQVTRNISEAIVMSPKTSNNGFIFPLYLIADSSKPNELDLRTSSDVNFAPAFLQKISSYFTNSQVFPNKLTPNDIFYYIYAVFHSPNYRRRYAEYLKIDFPRLPLTNNADLFRTLARLGDELTALQLLESPKVSQPISQYIGSPSPLIETYTWSDDTVWVDKRRTTGFKGVPEDVWNFHIGGYQVCLIWLKYRKGRTLSDDDIAHYHKIVVALSETIRLMREIDEVIDQHGGWPGAFMTSTAGNDV